MMRIRDRIFGPGHRMERTFSRWTVAALVVTVAFGVSCKKKKTPYFLTDGGGIVDFTPPNITGFEPTSGAILNSDEICATVTDPGINGDASGVMSVTARTSAGTSIPVQPGPTPGKYIGDISALGDGLHTIQWTATDQAGNEATATQNFTKDGTDPAVNVTEAPSAMGSTTQQTAQVRIAGTASDANLLEGMLFVRMGQGPTCSASDPLFAEGTGPGTVNENTFTLGATFDATIIKTGAPNEQRPRTTIYCYDLLFNDRGVTKTGTANPNTNRQFFHQEFTWQTLTQPPGNVTGQVTVNGVGESGVTVTLREGTTVIATTTTDAGGNYQFTNVSTGTKTLQITPPSGATCPTTQQDVNVPSGGTATANFACTRPSGDFTVTLTASYRHIMAGSSETCADFSVNPAQPGGTWMTTWSGPGTVGSTTRSGTLTSGTSGFDRQPINAFGTYNVNVAVTSGSITRMASGSVNVGAAQGTCTAPSSSRFKRGIVSLMPDGMTLLGLRPVVFRYLAPYGDPMVPQIGLIAEEVVEVFPEAVTLDAQGRPDGIYYSVLTRLVLEEIEDRVEQALAKGISRLVTSP